MLQIAPGTKVYISCKPTSLRKGFDDLAAEVSAGPLLRACVCVQREKRGLSEDTLLGRQWPMFVSVFSLKICIGIS